jgi:hypothetical protein
VGTPVAFAHGARRDDDVEASAGQSQCAALPDTAAGAGDQGHSAVVDVCHDELRSPIYMIPAI